MTHVFWWHMILYCSIMKYPLIWISRKIKLNENPSMLHISNLITMNFNSTWLKLDYISLCARHAFSTGWVEFLQRSGVKPSEFLAPVSMEVLQRQGVQHLKRLAPLSNKGANEDLPKTLKHHGNIIPTQNSMNFFQFRVMRLCSN